MEPLIVKVHSGNLGQPKLYLIHEGSTSSLLNLSELLLPKEKKNK